MVQSSQGFQSQVNQVPAPGVEGDFATLNPFYEYPFGPGGAVAGPNGLTVGRACWLDQTYLDPDNAPTQVNNYGTGVPIGILGRRQQGVITTFLAEGTMLVPAGLGVGVLSAADIWVKNSGTTQAQIGQKAYAAFADGTWNFAATGNASAGGSATSSTVAAATASVTGSIADNVLTVTAVGSGTLYNGSTMTGGSGLVAGTKIVSQLSGTAGGVGTYALSIGGQTVAAGTTLGATYGLLTLGTLTGAAFAVNDVISGSGVTSGTVITASITGSGGTGATMAVDHNTVVSSTTITVAAINVETSWYATSSGVAGEIVKISRLP